MQTSGGLHGVGSSVVNALSEVLEVEVARDRVLFKQSYARGKPTGKLKTRARCTTGGARRSVSVPIAQIFGDAAFSPARLYRLCRSKAYLFRGVEIRWSCDPALLSGGDGRRASRGGPAFSRRVEGQPRGRHRRPRPRPAGDVGGRGRFANVRTVSSGRVEWAIAWLEEGDGFLHSYCNTVPTPQGGTHEAGLRAALLKGLRAWGEQRANRRAAQITAEDLLAPMAAKLSLFMRDPQFQGQTKEKLTSNEAARLVETAMRDRFDHWLAADPGQADNLLAFMIERAEERLRRKEAKDTAAQIRDAAAAPAGQADRLHAEERDRDGNIPGRGRQRGRFGQAGAQSRETQAVLPLRGKILNVASRLGGQAAAEPGAEGPHRGAWLRGRRAVRPGSCATAASSS